MDEPNNATTAPRRSRFPRKLCADRRPSDHYMTLAADAADIGRYPPPAPELLQTGCLHVATA